MVSRWWLYVFILAVPLIGLAVGEGGQAYFNAQLRAAVAKAYPDVPQETINTLTMDALCTDPEYRSELVCIDYRNLNLLSAASVGAGVAGVFLLLAIRAAGAFARADRTRLLRVFKPGLYVTGVALIVLVLVHAAIGMAAVYYGESLLVQRIHGAVILGIGVGALSGVVSIGRNVFALFRDAQSAVIGKPVSRDEAPALWERVGALADRMGALQPDEIILGLEPQFFVTEVPVRSLGGVSSDRTLYCSLPLMRMLTVREFEAIMGHELAHFKGLDTRFSQQFYPIYRGTAGSLEALAHQRSGSRYIALLPAIAVFRYFLESFAVAEAEISRERELLADREAAALTDARTVGAALVKAHAYSGGWAALVEAAAAGLAEGRILANLSKAYTHLAAAAAKPDTLAELASTQLAHPTDSHPTLSTRLEALGCTIEELTDDALNITPDPAAITLVSAPEALEEALSLALQGMLGEDAAAPAGSDPGAEQAAGLESN